MPGDGALRWNGRTGRGAAEGRRDDLATPVEARTSFRNPLHRSALTRRTLGSRGKNNRQIRPSAPFLRRFRRIDPCEAQG